MAHEDLGGKTLLYLIDGLYGGYYAITYPYPWVSAPFGQGENGDWPSSLLASMDPVAIDSVAHDFLLEEWPDVVLGGTVGGNSLQGGAEDYLHEAALAYAPPSGTFSLAPRYENSSTPRKSCSDSPPDAGLRRPDNTLRSGSPL